MHCTFMSVPSNGLISRSVMLCWRDLHTFPPVITNCFAIDLFVRGSSGL